MGKRTMVTMTFRDVAGPRSILTAKYSPCTILLEAVMLAGSQKHSCIRLVLGLDETPIHDVCWAVE